MDNAGGAHNADLLENALPDKPDPDIAQYLDSMTKWHLPLPWYGWCLSVGLGILFTVYLVRVITK